MFEEIIDLETCVNSLNISFLIFFQILSFNNFYKSNFNPLYILSYHLRLIVFLSSYQVILDRIKCVKVVLDPFFIMTIFGVFVVSMILVLPPLPFHLKMYDWILSNSPLTHVHNIGLPRSLNIWYIWRSIVWVKLQTNSSCPVFFGIGITLIIAFRLSDYWYVKKLTPLSHQ